MSLFFFFKVESSFNIVAMFMQLKMSQDCLNQPRVLLPSTGVFVTSTDRGADMFIS